MSADSGRGSGSTRATGGSATTGSARAIAGAGGGVSTIGDGDVCSTTCLGASRTRGDRALLGRRCEGAMPIANRDPERRAAHRLARAASRQCEAAARCEDRTSW